MNLKENIIHIRRNIKLFTKKFDLIIYSEYQSDLNHTYKITQQFSKKCNKICYITSDQNDNKKNVEKKLNFSVEFFYISSGIFRTFVFNFLKSKFMILTLTDIDNNYLKKSKFVSNYIYIFHSITSTHMCYLEDAFDNYDVIFCVGKYQFKEIRKREKIYKLKPKKLLPYYHARIQTLRNLKNKNYNCKKKIIICSTWGKNSISETLDNDFLINLLEEKIEVFFQLHKMSLNRVNKLNIDLEKIKNQYEKFTFSYEYLSPKKLSEYSVMLSDWSGAATEFAFGFKRPVIFIDLKKKVRNFNYKKLNIIPFEVSIREKIGKLIKPSEINNLPSLVENLLKKDQVIKWESKIENLENKFFFGPKKIESEIDNFLNKNIM
tara:strand:+ start:313 stop:1443 length:1131 start_codon:yes stop_codon:yes gene_type:complete